MTSLPKGGLPPERGFFRKSWLLRAPADYVGVNHKQEKSVVSGFGSPKVGRTYETLVNCNCFYVAAFTAKETVAEILAREKPLGEAKICTNRRTRGNAS